LPRKSSFYGCGIKAPQGTGSLESKIEPNTTQWNSHSCRQLQIKAHPSFRSPYQGLNVVATAIAGAAALGVGEDNTSSLGPDDIVGHNTNNFLYEVAEDFKFWGSGVTVGALGVWGFVGNVLSLLTIAGMKKRNVFNNLLLLLTAFDMVFLVTGGLFFTQRSFKFSNYYFMLLFPKVIYPLAGISMTGKYKNT